MAEEREGEMMRDSNEETKNKVIIGEADIKCPECGCEVFSTPMPMGKLKYMPGRSLVAGQPDYILSDAVVAVICTKCKKFIPLADGV